RRGHDRHGLRGVRGARGGDGHGVARGRCGGWRSGRAAAWGDDPVGRWPAHARPARPLPRAHDGVAGAGSARRARATGGAGTRGRWSAPRMKLSAHGISVELPHGWEGKIYRRRGGDPTFHAANYALPGWDGDFGSVATEHMPTSGSFLVITEYRPGQGLEPGKGLFAADAIPLPLDAREFRSRTLHIGRRGQLGFQH